MRRTALASLTAAGLLACVLPAGAATTGPQVTDALGDANGLNGQALGLPVPSTPTSPASYSAADILSIRLSTDFKTVNKKKVPFAFDVTLKLADAPSAGVLYSLSATTSTTCDGTGSTLLLDDQDLKAVHTSFADCEDSTNTSTNIAYDVAAIDTAAHTITWTVDAHAMKPGTVISGISASTSAFVVGVIDEAKGDATYVYGK